MANQGLSLPSSGGGLMRYSEEYKSKLMLKPSHVIVYIIALIVLVIGLKVLYPIA